jgi:hypothetical protein
MARFVEAVKMVEKWDALGVVVRRRRSAPPPPAPAARMTPVIFPVEEEEFLKREREKGNM